jgi:hypothetical protein
LRHTQKCAHGDEPLIAGADVVAPFAFEPVQKSRDQFATKVIE